MIRTLRLEAQSWPLAEKFVISRGSKTHADVVLVQIQEGSWSGWGECVPYARYGETVTSVLAEIESMRSLLESEAEHDFVISQMQPGAARNAIDCALWDLRTKSEDLEALIAQSPKSSCETAQTVSMDTPERMAMSARKLADFPLLKVKLGADAVCESIRAIHQSAPGSKLIVDANEAWTLALLNEVVHDLNRMNVVLIEQPLPADQDEALREHSPVVPLCADESFHCSNDLERVAQYYQCINIKLDKTGGLTEALKVLDLSGSMPVQVMLGCMVGTSLAMAPAFALNRSADFVDLDGPALLAEDRPDGFEFRQGRMTRPERFLWGQ